MTVKDLIALLSEAPPDLPVLIAADSEGNGFSFPEWVDFNADPDDSGERKAAVIWPLHTERGIDYYEMMEHLEDLCRELTT